jgi:hypothetical protein
VNAETPSRPVVGAIRWDGWHGGGVGNSVTKSLTPTEWRDRLPFFATIREDGSPELRGDTPEVMTSGSPRQRPAASITGHSSRTTSTTR